MVKIIKRVGYLLLLPLFLSLQACEKEQLEEKKTVRPVRAMKVNDVVQFRQRQFPGTATATQEVDLSFRVSGPLITLPVNIGDEVKVGDVVARIDPRDFEVSLNNVRGQLDKALANVKRAQSEFDREMRILEQDPGATSQTAVDRKRSQRDQARADIKSLQASVASAKDKLNYTYLKVPFDGVVVSTYAKNFEFVQAKQSIVRIVDNSRIEMVINIPESLISMVPQAKNIEVVFDPFPDRKIPAEIKEIGTEASRTTRTYPVTLIMNQPEDINILPGMAGKATGEPATDDMSKLAIGKQVPVTAILSPDDIDKTYVWIIDEQSNSVSKREVTTGKLTDTGIMVTDGLEAGERIATAGVNYLREGMEVRILEETTE
ncbi:MAG: efflux RND transporter periplasmic adaptor subunit [Gammaproteobacteria bacterium]|nr:efflux RND transporter periplasmic adaptor subunit [Gammaproteobacteria bacterium]